MKLKGETPIPDLLGIVGSISSTSKTRTAVEVALAAAERAHGVETAVLHLGEYDLDTADGRRLEDYEGDTQKALALIIESEAFIIGTPVYRATYSGLLKNLFDMIPRGLWQADVAPLANRAVGLVATGASAHHYLAIDEGLRPLMAFFGAHVLGGSVYAHGEHFDDDDRVSDAEIRERLERLGRGTVDLARAIRESEDLSNLGPQI